MCLRFVSPYYETVGFFVSNICTAFAFDNFHSNIQILKNLKARVIATGELSAVKVVKIEPGKWKLIFATDNGLFAI